jgi:hypothetical protein
VWGGWKSGEGGTQVNTYHKLFPHEPCHITWTSTQEAELPPGTCCHLTEKDSGGGCQLKVQESGRNIVTSRDTAQTRKKKKREKEARDFSPHLLIHLLQHNWWTWERSCRMQFADCQPQHCKVEERRYEITAICTEQTPGRCNILEKSQRSALHKQGVCIRTVINVDSY